MDLGIPLPTAFLQPETGTTDDLVTINGAKFMQQELWVRGVNDTVTITVKNSGNIRTHDGNDFDIVGKKYYRFVYDVADEKWVQTTTQGTGGGGGGNTEPFLTTIQSQSGTGSLNVNLLFHTHVITMTGDVTVNFTNPPASGKSEDFRIRFLHDGGGGTRTVTWPGSVNSPPSVVLSAGEQALYVLTTEDNGTSYDIITLIGSSSGGDNLGNHTATQDLQMSNKDIIGVANIDFDGVSATLEGLVNLQFFQTSQSINSLSGQLVYQGQAGDDHLFVLGGVPVAKFEEPAGGVYRLNMQSHTIDEIKDLRFTGDYAAAGSSPAIGYNSSTTRLLVNYPTGGAGILVTENNTIGSTQIKTDSIDSNIVNANDLLQIGVDVTAPIVSGEFRNDGTDTFVYSGGAVRNLSNIGVAAGGANVFLSNLTSPTSINQNLIPQAGKTLGDSGNPWSRITVNTITLGTAGTFGASDNGIIADATLGMRYNAASAQLHEFRLNNEVMAQISRVGTSQGDLLMHSLSPNRILMQNLGLDPSIAGMFSRNGADVKVFSGGAVRNLSNIGGGGISNVVEDLSPQLGGVLDAQGFSVDDTDEVNFGTETTQSDKFAIGRGGDILTIQIGSNGSGASADTFRVRRGTQSQVILDENGWEFTSAAGIGFYGTTPIAQQTGVAVTAAGIHAALVNLGLITA